MNTQYDITDITDRLEDLDSYLDDLETALESARDAKRDMENYAQNIAELDALRTLAEAFTNDGLPARLEDYIAAHRHEWDHPTEQLFNRLADLLAQAEDIQATGDTPLLTAASVAVSYNLCISRDELATIERALASALVSFEPHAWLTPELTLFHRNLSDLQLRLAKLPHLPEKS